MKLKICGMKYPSNIIEVASLMPDYIGFIFYEKSARFFEGDIPVISDDIKKVGVFVNESVDAIKEMTLKYNLGTIQLHGNESAEYCSGLRELLNQHFDKLNVTLQHDRTIEIIKAFSVNNEFDFAQLKPYETVVDYYLFDTKGELPGGNGFTFDWKILESYSSNKPYFLSGGIGLNEVDNLRAFFKSKASRFCHTIDINSKFETEPGFKNIEMLKAFKSQLP